jgi:putative transposase
LHHEVEKVGIDLGVKTFATFSDGTTVKAPVAIKQTKIKLAKLQWRNRNKQLGDKKAGIPASNNAKKYYKQVAKLQARISNVRRDFLQKLTGRVREVSSQTRPVKRAGIPLPRVRFY